MPPKDYQTTQIYFATGNGEFYPASRVVAIEEYPEVISEELDSVIHNLQSAKSGQFRCKISKTIRRKLNKMMQNDRPNYLVNNWRRRHHLPLIRKIR